MKRTVIKQLVLALATGAVLLQTATCAQQITALATTVTAGSALFIVNQIIND
jgi:hypothetical protein